MKTICIKRLRMKRFLGGLAISVLFGTQGMAADLPVRMPVKAAPAPVVPAFSWGGCYVGGHAGVYAGRTKTDLPTFTDTALNDYSQTYKYTDFAGGGQIGCNIQSGAFVYGIEGDSAWLAVNKSSHPDLEGLSDLYRTRMDWTATIRGRLGYAWDRTLIYATGGVAFARITNTYENYTNPSLTVLLEIATRRSTDVGWTAGGGIQFALTPNWIIGGEYLYMDFGKGTLPTTPIFGVFGDTFVRNTAHVGRIRLDYKFSGEPIVARF